MNALRFSRVCGEKGLLPEEAQKSPQESEARARNVRKFVCDIVHMQVSAIIVTRDLTTQESVT